MNTISRLLLISCLSAFLVGNTLAEDIIATVDGKKITKKELETYANYRQSTSKQKIDDPNVLLQEMINRELLYKKAVKAKADKDPDVKYVLDQQKRDLMIQALLRKTEIGKPVDESELKKLYDEKIKTQKIKEYQVKHILLKTEAEAKTVIAELDGGAEFEELAKSKSSGPSAKEGGSIGWVNSAQLKQMPTFAQAVSEMKKGSISKAPVQTQYGWHVIKLDDSRKLTPPTYDKVKDQLANAVRQQRLQEYVKNIRDKAKVKITTPK